MSRMPIILVLLMALGLLFFMVREGGKEQAPETPLPLTRTHPQLRELNVRSGNSIASPFALSGEAQGWYFEGSFPIELLDGNRNQIAITIAEATEEWMTPGFVPFKATLIFKRPETETGFIVLRKDNPSDDRALDDSFEIPIRFDQSPLQETTLSYYNPELDRDSNGNILCTERGLVLVAREIPKTQTPIQDTIRLLLKGELTLAERFSGISTEFPLPGFSLTGASLSKGVLTLSFDDPQNASGGGSCRTALLAAQIKATAKTFPEVKEVRFIPKDLFQP